MKAITSNLLILHFTMLGVGVFLFYIAPVVWDETTWEVELFDQGTVRGYRDVSGKFYTFRDVPYATVPNGTNKFKGPLPPPVWNDIFNATYRGITCTQTILPGIVTQDDCLVANIVVPDTNNKPPKGLPVMVSIHGGAYCIGAGSWFQYTSLAASQRLIVVTFNYRLGVPGFLCLRTIDVPGNAGMKDQVALLRWVKKNIAKFGGDPDNVTIQGCSAGGSSVDFLTISPMAKGLFNKAIIESGSVLGFLGAVLDPIENAKTYAKLLNFTDAEDIEALEEFYKTTPNEVLNFNFTTMFTDTTVAYFAPCVELDTCAGEEIFLPESPWSLLSKGQYTKIPLLYGYVEHEGLFHLGFKQINFESFIIEMSQNFSHHLPFDLKFETKQKRLKIANATRQFYFGNTMNAGSILEYIKYYTDILFAYPMLDGLSIRRSDNHDTVYLYEFGFVDENTPFIPNTTVRGVTHGLQMFVLADSTSSSYTTEYLQMQKTLREMWINFVVYGRPVPEDSTLPQWPPVCGIRTPHMAIRNNFSMSETLIVEDRAAFWDPIYKKYYNNPQTPMRGGAC